jgi:hypothetical protein
MTLPLAPDTPKPARRRPSPGRALALVRALKAAGAIPTLPKLVAATRRETGCSRATAYRALSDALAAGRIKPAGVRRQPDRAQWGPPQ